MIWQDEFDFFDSNKWGNQNGDGCQLNLCGWGNGEMVRPISFLFMHSVCICLFICSRPP